MNIPYATLARRLWRGAPVLVAAGLLGCTEPRTDFLTRLGEDCKAGDSGACDLLRAPPGASVFAGLPDAQSGARDLVQQDLEAMLRGMAQAHASSVNRRGALNRSTP